MYSLVKYHYIAFQCRCQDKKKGSNIRSKQNCLKVELTVGCAKLMIMTKGFVLH